MSYTTAGTNWTSTNANQYYYYDMSGQQIQPLDEFKYEPPDLKIPEQIWWNDMGEVSRLKEEIQKMKDALRIILDCLKLNPYHTKEIIEDISMLIDDFIDTEEDVEEEEFITDKDLRI